MKEAKKRVNIVSIKMVKDGSMTYSPRQIRSPLDAANIFRQFLGETPDREVFLALCVDTKNQPTAISVVSVGSLNATLVHPREVLKLAILSNSAALLVAHVHPSGIPEPSKEDLEVTRRLVESGRLLGIELLDHIILAGDRSYVSLKERGQV